MSATRINGSSARISIERSFIGFFQCTFHLSSEIFGTLIGAVATA